MITLASIFRNSTGYLDRYFKQIAALREHVDVCLILVEGDSTDDTRQGLTDRLVGPGLVAHEDHGGANYGSIDHPTRWANIAKVVRKAIGLVNGEPGDAFVYIESDLIWNPKTIVRLLEADRPVAPMVYASDDLPAGISRFYDTWGFRQGGRYFLPAPPYSPFGMSLGDNDRYEKIDSCGNCFVVPGEEFDIVEKWDGMWPFPADGRLWLDTQSQVRHP